MNRRALLTALLAVLLSSCSGGGKPGNYGGADGKKIADLISDLDDTLQNPKKTAATFSGDAQAKVTAGLAKYRSLTYSLVGEPVVSGNTATAQVAIEQSSSGKKLGEKEWTFVKEGEAWKIQSAPLP
jgi:hypothetical protein